MAAEEQRAHFRRPRLQSSTLYIKLKFTAESYLSIEGNTAGKAV